MTKRSRRGRSKSSNTGIWIMLAIFIGWYWFSSDDKSSVTPPHSASTPSTTKPAMIWPPPLTDASVAADLGVRNYYVILDGSGSMSDDACKGAGSKIQQSRAALKAFADAVPQQANLGLEVFDSRGIRELIPLGTGNRAQFVNGVNSVSPAGGTPLSDAIAMGRRVLEAQAARQLGYGEYHLVIVTDGVADLHQNPTGAVDDMLSATPIVLHTIGFCLSTSHALNQPGRTIYKTAHDTRELAKGLEEVLAESPDFTSTNFEVVQ